MRILFLYNMLRMNGIHFTRSHYLIRDLESRGHKVLLAYQIVEDRAGWEELEDDLITYRDVDEYKPDVLIIELGEPSRIPSRKWLNEVKKRGCIIVHSGLPYNDYNDNRKSYDDILGAAGFAIFKGEAGERGELPNIRGKLDSQIAETPIETLKEYCAIQDPAAFNNVSRVYSRFALVIESFKHILITSGPRSSIKAYNSPLHGESNSVYGAFNDTNGIEILITGYFAIDGKDDTQYRDNRTFLINILEYLNKHNAVTYGVTDATLDKKELSEQKGLKMKKMSKKGVLTSKSRTNKNRKPAWQRPEIKVAIIIGILTVLATLAAGLVPYFWPRSPNTSTPTDGIVEKTATTNMTTFPSSMEDQAESIVKLYYDYIEENKFDEAAMLLDPALLLALGGREDWQNWSDERSFTLPEEFGIAPNGNVFRVWLDGLVITPNGRISEPPAFYSFCIVYDPSESVEWKIVQLHDEKVECW